METGEMNYRVQWNYATNLPELLEGEKGETTVPAAWRKFGKAWKDNKYNTHLNNDGIRYYCQRKAWEAEKE